MREQGSGRIINISSIGAVIYEPFGAWYHATKFAVDGFSDSLRVELRPFGIDVVLVHPAGIVTEWNEIARTSLVERSKDGVYAASAVKAAKAMAGVDNPRLSSGPDVVAKAIVKAATARRPKSRYSTGKGASTVMTTRRVLPDRAFDAIMTRLYID